MSEPENSRKRSQPGAGPSVSDSNLQMSREIDFTKSWFKADVTLKPQNSDELLYANKNYLATHSPYFDAVFFGDFSESGLAVIDVPIGYDEMHEILMIIHMKNKRREKTITISKLLDLYRAGDKFDIEAVIQFVKKMLLRMDHKKALIVAVALDLPEIRRNILQKMSIDEFLDSLNQLQNNTFTGSDVKIIVNKIISQLNNSPSNNNNSPNVNNNAPIACPCHSPPTNNYPNNPFYMQPNSINNAANHIWHGPVNMGPPAPGPPPPPNSASREIMRRLRQATDLQNQISNILVSQIYPYIPGHMGPPAPPPQPHNHPVLNNSPNILGNHNHPVPNNLPNILGNHNHPVLNNSPNILGNHNHPVPNNGPNNMGNQGQG